MRLVRYFPVACCALAVGCGTQTIDAAKAEREIADGVERKTATKDVTIDCPDGVELKKGDVFECDLTAAGDVRAQVKVTQVDGDGRLDWELNP
jgi:hypothetical protein